MHLGVKAGARARTHTHTHIYIYVPVENGLGILGEKDYGFVTGNMGMYQYCTKRVSRKKKKEKRTIVPDMMPQGYLTNLPTYLCNGSSK